MRTTHRLTARLVAVTVAAAAVVYMTIDGARAATTYTPAGGPGITFTGSNVSFTDILAEQTMTCAQFDPSGSVVDSGISRPYGVTATNLTTLLSSGCWHWWFGNLTFTPTGTWGFTIIGDAVGSAWPAQLANVAVTVTGAGCSLDIAGSIAGIFDDATQVFDPLSGPSGLTMTAVVGATCPLLGFEVGDEFEVNGTWTASPPLDISNP